MIVSKCRSVLDGFNLRSFQNALTSPVCNCPMIVSKCRSFLQVSNELREPAISTALAKRIAGALPKVKVMNAEFEWHRVSNTNVEQMSMPVERGNESQCL